MATQIVFISGVILGFLLGMLVCYVCLSLFSRPLSRGREQEVEGLVDDFQELFRQIHRDKNQDS